MVTACFDACPPTAPGVSIAFDVPPVGDSIGSAELSAVSVCDPQLVAFVQGATFATTTGNFESRGQLRLVCVEIACVCLQALAYDTPARLAPVVPREDVVVEPDCC